MPTFLMIFRRFPTTFQRFTKILQNLSGGHMNITEHFSKNFWRLPKISEDCQRLSRKTGRYFTYTPTNLSTTSWDKLDVSEIINIFTNEDMENAPPESQMWFRMNLGEVYFPLKHSCLYNKPVYRMTWTNILYSLVFEHYNFTLLGKKRYMYRAAQIYPNQNIRVMRVSPIRVYAYA